MPPRGARKAPSKSTKKTAKDAAASSTPPAAEPFEGMAEAFDRAQRSAVNHAKATATLLTLLQEAAAQQQLPAFQAAFLAQLSRTLVVFKRELAVERAIEFAVKFVALAEKVR